jgi:hypothetical protein
MPDDAGGNYSRIYGSLARDHPRVWFDPPILGWYVRLLLPADRAWPGIAELPRTVPDEVLDVLVADEVIDLVGSSGYRFHGLDAERNGRRGRGYVGGKVRASSAPRDAGGRFAPDAGDLNRDAGRMLEDAAGETLELRRWTSSKPANLTEPKGVGDDILSSSPTPVDESTSRAPAREGPAPTAVDCSDYQAHRADHRWIEGVGWKCVACEATRALAEPSFREKVEQAGGDAW